MLLTLVAAPSLPAQTDSLAQRAQAAYTASDWKTAAWRGMVAPKGIPADVRDKLAGALKKIVASKEYNDFMAGRGYGVIYAGPDDFAKFMAKSDTELGATMKAVGIAK